MIGIFSQKLTLFFSTFAQKTILKKFDFLLTVEYNVQGHKARITVVFSATVLLSFLRSVNRQAVRKFERIAQLIKGAE